MAAQLFYLPFRTATVNGIAQSGAKAYFYNSGTSTPHATYKGSNLATAHSHPVVSNGVGKFPDIYLDGTVTYRLKITDKNGVTILDTDPYIAGTAADASELQPYVDQCAANVLSASASAATAIAATSGLSASDIAVVSPQMYGATGGGVVDDTTAIANAISAAQTANCRLHIPAGTYIVSQVAIPANLTVTTDGFNTIIKQKAATAAGTPIIKIAGSNVRIEDIAVEGLFGQTGDVTDEQNHGILIYIGAADTASRSNITLGNVRGTNIRGDVIMLGIHPTAYAAGYRLSTISIGSIIGANVFRAVSSVVGGSDIDIQSVTGTQVGKIAFNAEQDAGGGPITGLRVHYIKGRSCQFAGPTAAEYIEAWAGHIDVDPSYTTTSSPDYGATDYQDGLIFRNCKSLRVERLYANGHYGQALKPITGALTRQNISFGTIEIPSSCTTEASRNCYIFGDATTYLTIDNLFATSTLSTHRILSTVTNAKVGVANVALVTGSAYMRDCLDCATDVLAMSVSGGGNGGSAVVSCTRVAVRGGIQTGDYFFNSSIRCVAQNVEATMASSYDNSGTNNQWISSRQGTAYVALQQNGSYAIDDSGKFAPLSLAIGSGTALTKAVVYTPSITPSSVSAATVAEQTFTVTGLTTADKVIVNPPAISNATGIVGARVSAANTLALRFTNPTAGALTPTSGTYTVLAFRS